MQTLFHSHFTLLPHVKRAPIYLLPLVGVILILFAENLTTLLPYLLGPVMILEGILLAIPSIRAKEYKTMETKATAASVVLCIVGILILYKRKDCLHLMGTVWGLYGLISGTNELNEAFYRIAHRQRYWLPLLEAVITLALAVLLLADPFHSFVHHVQILGIELIISVFRPKHHTAAHGGQVSQLEASADMVELDQILSSEPLFEDTASSPLEDCSACQEPDGVDAAGGPDGEAAEEASDSVPVSL